MKSFCVTASLGVLMAVPVVANGWQILDGGWRISAGAVYDSGVKTRMRMTPRAVFVAPQASGTADYGSADEAQRAAWEGTTDEKGTVSYKNTKAGATSWYNPDDGSQGEYSDGTGAYRLPSSVWDAEKGVFTLGYATWEKVDPLVTDSSTLVTYESDDSGMPGVNVELSRNLFHDVEYGWGVDLAFAVQYFRRNDAFHSSTSWFNGEAVRNSGGFYSTYAVDDDTKTCLTDETLSGLFWHDDGAGGKYIGDGGDKIAPEFYPNGIARSKWNNDPEYFGSSTGYYDVKGDYENLELMLLARPYYDIFDWLRVNATCGLVVSRQSMEMSFMMLRDGAVDYRSDRDFSQWDVYGVGGLGLMLYYKDFTLSGDFLARFLDDDMTIDDRYCHGSVERGAWMFKVAIGYEF